MALAISLLFAACTSLAAQGNEWVWVGGNEQLNQDPVYGTQGVASSSATPGARVESVTWTDAQGNLWLFGGINNQSLLADMWELSPSTGKWTWVGGSIESGAPGIYGTLQVASAANLPGARGGAVGWTDANGDLWLFGGSGRDSAGNSGYLNDLWKYHPASGQWTWMGGSSLLPSCPSTNSCGPSGVYGQLGVPALTDQPGGRGWATAWTDAKGNFWLFGGRIYGVYLNGWNGEMNDLWTYDPKTNLGTWMGGSNSIPSDCSMLNRDCGQPGVYGTLQTPSNGNIPGSREMAAHWTDSSGNLWLMGGYGFDAHGIYGLLNDLWRFNPSAGTWTWMSGVQSIDSAYSGPSGLYGMWQTEAASNMPGGRTTSASWADGAGNLWLFGGVGFGATAAAYGRLNDLWRFDTAIGQWAWMSGSASAVQNGAYGVLGTPSLANTPGARNTMAFWTDASGNFWLFGGDGQGVLGNTAKHYHGLLSDLWKFVPQTGNASSAAAPEFTPAGGMYTSVQSVSLSDTTPGATIYYRIGTDGAAKLYSAPIAVQSAETIQAIATASGYANSKAAAASYTINLPPPPAPTFSPASGSFYNVAQVLITDAESDATIYYTLDHSTPTPHSSVYSNGVNITASGTLQAIAVGLGGTSPIATASYTINPPRAATPSFSLAVGTYITPQTVTISDATPGSAIYYTTDGSVPTTASPQYTAPISIASTQTVQAIAAANGYGPSALATATYTISSSQTQPPPGASNEWMWMGGGFSGNANGKYGSLGMEAPGNAPGVRNQSVAWTDSKGNLWLFGGEGFDSAQTFGYLNDLWKYSPSTNQWTWMGGSSTLLSGLAQGVYGTMGTPAPGNIPPGRSGAVRWTDAHGNLWLFGGDYQDFTGTGMIAYLNDLWKFDPSANEWTWMSGSNAPNQRSVYGSLGVPAAGNVPGAGASGVTWVDKQGNLWLMEGNELWYFDPATNLWAWMGGSGDATCNAVFGTVGVAASSNFPGRRSGAVSWTDNSGDLWMFGGSGCNSKFDGGNLNDLWKYSLSTHEWTWMGGSDTTNQPGVYGRLQTPAPGNVPGSRVGAVSWTDSHGNFWMFGGLGRNTSTSERYLNDLWKYNPSTNEWAWMGGSDVANGVCEMWANWCGDFGVVGAVRTPALGNTPSGRYDSVGWTDSEGNLWLFAGSGYPDAGVLGALSDLWEYQPNTGAQAVVATPIFSPDSGTFTTWQSLTIADATPGAAISYTVNGATPAVRYTGPITVSSSETIEAIASAPGYANSNIATAEYVVSLPQAAAPTFSVAPGSYSAPQTVTISARTPGATIYYAIGPTAAVPSILYTGPLSVSSSETIQAMAVADNYSNSSIATAVYNIGSNPTAEWTWMGGSSNLPACTIQGPCGQPGWYGKLRTPAAANTPEGRLGSVTWTDSTGDFWMFGGLGVQGSLNDLWRYTPSSARWTWITGNSTLSYDPSTGSGQPGVYGTLGTPSGSTKPGSRIFAVGWADKTGKLWLFGGWGFDGNGALGNLNDLWEFDPSTNQWTWMGGSSTLTCHTGKCWDLPGVYGTFATPSAENFPGGRSESTAWTDANGHFWLYGGLGRDARDFKCYLNDLWEFDPSTKQWSWRGGNPECPSVLAGWPGVYDDLGVPSPNNNPWSLYYASSWADKNGNLWLFGGMGEDMYAVGWYLNDMWVFSPAINQWAWMKGTGGPGTYGPMGVWSSASTPGGRKAAATWTDKDGSFWLLGGTGLASGSISGAGLLNDLWEFKPSIDEWAWMGGSDKGECLKSSSGICVSWGERGVYGSLGTPAPENGPGARYSAATWTDNAGNLWLFGGIGNDAQGNVGYLNDMWHYSLKASPSAQPAVPAATPTFSLAAGPYTSAQTLTMSDSTPGAVIHYTTDGTMPNQDSAVYTSAIAVSSSETILALAVADNYAASDLAVAAYTINLPAAAAPGFDLASGTYTGPQTVTLSDATVGATIYFTTNGNVPTVSSTQYTGPISVSTTETIKAIAAASGYSNSSVASASYTITSSAATFSLAASPASLTVKSGSQGSTTLTVTPQNGFNAAVSFTCSGLPASAACSFSPKTVTPSGAAATTQLTISVNALASALRPTSRPFLPGSGLAVAVCLFFWKRRRVSGGTLLAVVFAGAMLLAGCGGASTGGAAGGGGGGSPQNYTVIVTATSGSMQQSSAISLTVN